LFVARLLVDEHGIEVTAFGGGMSPQSFGEWCAEIHEAALKRNPAALATGGDVK
jgi:hypothetical protein